MPTYTLRLYTPVLAGPAFVADVSKLAQDWKRSIRAVGGPWQGSFRLQGPPALLQQWFHEYLGYHLEERASGTVTWEGLIYEMELVHQGVHRRRSLDQLANAIKARYTDASDNTAKQTAFATDAKSLARYGRKEDALSLGTVSTASATSQRDTALKGSAWPWARPLSADPSNKSATLDVRVCGYIFTLNWKFCSVQEDATGDVSTYIHDIVAADCPFVSAGTFRSNTLQVKRETAIAARAWDTLKGLVEMGDASGNPWRLTIGAGRRVNYEQIDTTPRYYLREGVLYRQLSERVAVAPWLVQPAVIRDAGYPVTRAEPGSWLSDARDFWAEEVSVDANGNLSWTTAEPVRKLSESAIEQIRTIINTAPPAADVAPSPHALNSVHHTGTLDDAQAPQFLKTDGSRGLTNDLAVASGKKVDGVDISADLLRRDGSLSLLGNLAVAVGVTIDGVDISTLSPVTAIMLQSYSMAGTLVVGAGTLRLYNNTGSTWTIIAVEAAVGTPSAAGMSTPPGDADVKVDVNVNGSTIYGTSSHRPTIAAGAHNASGGTRSNSTVAPGDYLTVDVDQIGDATPGSDLTVMISYTES